MTNSFIIKTVFPEAKQAVVCEDSHCHGFKLNEIVEYIGTIEKSDTDYHTFENQNGKRDVLVNGEYEWLGDIDDNE